MKRSETVKVSGITILLLICVFLPLKATTAKGDSVLVDRLELLIPGGAFLRDYVRIPETEKILVIYILDYEISKKYPPDIYENTCPGQVNGQTIKGEYHLALIEGGKIINDVMIPIESGLGNITTRLGIVYRQLNKLIHRKFNGPKPKNEKEALEMSEVHILDLKDHTGEGKPYEFQIEVYVAGYGHVEVLTAGYSPKQDKAIVFPIIGKDLTNPYYWHDNFFPDDAGTVNWEYKCGDHANTIYSHEKFEFNKTIEAFVMTEYERISCKKKYGHDS